VRLDAPRLHRGLSSYRRGAVTLPRTQSFPSRSAASMGEKIQYRMTKSGTPRQSAEFPNMAKKF
jgi:hypothetical protein